MSSEPNEPESSASRPLSRISRSRDVFSDPLATQALRRALGAEPVASCVAHLDDFQLVREANRIGLVQASLARKLGKLPRIEQSAAPAPDVIAPAPVGEPEPAAPEESDPPLCAICMKAAAESGAPLMAA